MADEKDKFREQLLRKPLMEIESLIMGQKQKIGMEKNLMNLNRLNTELKIMQEVRDQKLRESGRHIQKTAGSSAKPVLKSYDDYVKSKKK